MLERLSKIVGRPRQPRTRRLLLLVATANQTVGALARLRPDEWHVLALAPVAGLRPLVDEFLPVGCPEEVELRDQGRRLARALVPEIVQGLPVEPDLVQHVLPLACEDHLFGPLRLARAVDLALAQGHWDAVAVAATTGRRFYGAAALAAALRHLPANRVLSLSPPSAARVPVAVPAPAPLPDRRAETLVVVRTKDPAYRLPALRLARELGAVVVSTGPRREEDTEDIACIAGAPPSWLEVAGANGRAIADREIRAVEGGGGTLGLGQGLAQFLAYGIADIACRAAGVEALLDAVRPCRVMLFGGRDAIARAVTLACRRRGIASVDVQVVLQSAHPRYRRSLAHVFCALTEDQARMYRSLYDTRHQWVERLGSLRMPELRAQFDAAGRNEVRAEVGLAGVVGPVILMATQPGFDGQAASCLAAIVAAAAGRPGSAVVVKPHPKEDAAFYSRLVEEHDGSTVRLVPPDYQVHRLLKGVDGVVNYCSNIGIEAAVLGLPVVAANLTGLPFAVDLAAMGVATGVDTVDALSEAVDAILTGQAAATGTEFIVKNREFLTDPLPRLEQLAVDASRNVEFFPAPASDPTD